MNLVRRPSAEAADVPQPALRFVERLFLRLCCYPPPATPFEPRDAYDEAAPPPMEPDALGRVRRVFGSRFEEAVVNRVVVDIGCGLGAQVIGMARAGSRWAVGIDKTAINLRVAAARAADAGVGDRVRFTLDPMALLGRDWADVILSQNSFEHFADPTQILQEAFAALKPGGLFFVTFGPTWWHPYGVHNLFMIRLPWMHCLFSERTILRVRQLYRPVAPATWRDAGLNQMTIRKLLKLVASTRFELVNFSVTPIRPLPAWLVRLPLFREWTTADVSVILRKPVPSEAPPGLGM